MSMRFNKLHSRLAVLSLIVLFTNIFVGSAATTVTGTFSSQTYTVAASDIAIDSSGNYYIAGAGDHYATSVSGMAVVEVANTANLKLGGMSTSVSGGEIMIAVPDGSGGVYVGGTFTSIGGSSRNRAAHIDSDGDVTSWNPNVNGTVYEIHVTNDAIYLGGNFTSVSGVTRNYAAAVDTTNGDETSWDPDMNARVLEIEEVSGKVYLGGYFTSGGASGGCTEYLCAVDPSTAIEASSANIEANAAVTSMMAIGTDLYVSGVFTTIGVTSRNYMAAIATASDAVKAFDPSPSSNASRMVNDGTNLYAVGNFTSIGGQSRNRAGAVALATGVATSWNPNPNVYVNDIAITSDNSAIYIAAPFGGTLTLDGDTPPVDSVAKVNTTDGDLISAWDIEGNPSESTYGYDVYYDGSHVNRGLALFGSDYIFMPMDLGTDFDYGKTYSAIKTNSSGTQQAWDPNPAGGVIDAIEVDSTYAYVAGEFDTINGEAIPALARVNLSDATVDTGWDPGFDTTDDVNDIYISGSYLYVVGDFEDVNGTSRSNTARLNISDASLDTGWDPPTLTATITSVMEVKGVLPYGSYVYAWGLFNNADANARPGFMRLSSTDGSLDTFTFTTGDTLITSALVSDVTIDTQQNNLYIGSNSCTMSNINTTGTAYTIVKYDLDDDSFQSSFNPSVGSGYPNCGITNLNAFNDVVLLSGNFDEVEGDSGLDYLAMINGADETASSWDINSNTSASSQVLNNALYVYNTFPGTYMSSVGGSNVNNLAEINLPVASLSSTTGSGAEETEDVTITINLSESAIEDISIPYTVTGTATGSGTDYTLADGTATISSGSTSGSITLSIIEDFLAESNETVIVTLTKAIYSILDTSNDDFTYTITDDDTPGVTVTEIEGSTDVSEAGTTDKYNIVLDTQPAEDVTIAISVDSNVTVDNSSLTFTSANWNTSQQLTVSAVDDSSVEGNHTSTITHTATSVDSDYNGASVSNVTVNITDNDSASGGGGDTPAVGGGGGGGGDSSDDTDTDDTDSGEDDTDEESPAEDESSDEENSEEEQEEETSSDESQDDKSSEENSNEDNKEESQNDSATEVPADEPAKDESNEDDFRGVEEDNSDDSNDKNDSDSESDDESDKTADEGNPDTDNSSKNEDDSSDDDTEVVEEPHETLEDKLKDFIDSQTDVSDDDGFLPPDVDNIDPEMLDDEEELELKCELKDDVESLRDEVGLIKAGYQSIRANIIEERTNRLGSLREYLQGNIASLKNVRTADIASEKKVYQDDIAELRVQYRAELDEVRSMYSDLIQKLRADKASAEEITQAKADRQVAIAEARAGHKEKVAIARAEYQSRIAEIRSVFTATAASYRAEYQANVNDIKIEYADKLADAKEGYLARLAEVRSQIVRVNAAIKKLKGGSCEELNVDTSDDTGDDEQEDDGQDDDIEEAIGTDKDKEDTDDDGIDDIDETFTTYTDPNDPDNESTTAGVTGQQVVQSSGGGRTNHVKSKGTVVVSGIAPEGTQLGCVVEKSPKSTNAVSSYRCDEKFIQDERGVYMMEFVPRDGDGDYTFRVVDSNGLIERFNVSISSSYRIGMPTLYDFGGQKDDGFTYVTDNQIVVNEAVGNFPTSVLDPTGCVAFGQCVIQARWNSLIFSSVILADSSASRAVLRPPRELEDGEHRVLFATVDTETNEISDTLEVNFVVDESLQNIETERINLFRLAYWQLLLILLILIVLLIALRKVRNANQPTTN